MRPLWYWVLLENGMNICELMGMGILWTKKELISELSVENSKIDGDFERISSPFGEYMMLSFYSEA